MGHVCNVKVCLMGHLSCEINNVPQRLRSATFFRLRIYSNARRGITQNEFHNSRGTFLMLLSLRLQQLTGARGERSWKHTHTLKWEPFPAWPRSRTMSAWQQLSVCACVCVWCLCCTHKCASPWKEALRADLQKELITGGKTALITLPCGLSPECGWGEEGWWWGYGWRAEEKAMTLVPAHWCVRISHRSEWVTLWPLSGDKR